MGTVAGVAVAGALGALARYGLGGWLAERSRGAFPWETLIVNLSDSLVLGFLFVLLTERLVVSPSLRVSMTVGFLGAYTTFSTFSLETMRLIEDGAVWIAALNVLVTIAAGLLAVWLGMTVGRAL